jgi:enoyl-CoA hydratase/carnithine racemase
MKSFNTITVTEQESVATLTFNRPYLLNAMDREMMDEIIDALKMIVENEGNRVAVITGTGRAFMAGADIKEYAVQTVEQFKAFQNKGKELYQLIEDAGIPFIAAVNGVALGGGFEIALACDMIIASETAKMGLPEVHLGLIPGGGGTHRLIQKIGLNRVREMLMLGNAYTAKQMLDWGIVNSVSTENDLSIAVKETADKLKRRPAQSLKVFKQLLKPQAIELPFVQRIEQEGIEVLDLFYSPLAQDLINQFVSKNK